MKHEQNLSTVLSPEAEPVLEGDKEKAPVGEQPTEGGAEVGTSSIDTIIPQNNGNVKHLSQESENKFYCNIDTKAYKDKETAKRENDKIVIRMKNKNRITKMTAERLAKAVTMGYCFTTAALNGTTAAHFVSQQLAIVDIDNENKDVPITTVGDAEKVLAEHGIEYSFMYYSFSHSTFAPKFRIVCVLEKPITDPAEAKRLNQYLISLFVQADKICHNLDRFYYPASPSYGLATEVRDRVTTINVPADFMSLESERAEDSPPLPEPPIGDRDNELTPKTKGKKDAPAGQLKLGQAYRDFDLLGYIEQTTGIKPERKGRNFVFNPCPLCGFHDHFQIDVEKTHLYHSKSDKDIGKGVKDGGESGGNIFNYLKAKNPEFSDTQARDYFKYDILGLDREAEKKAYKEGKKQERVKNQTGREDIDYSQYIYDNKVNCALLAEYVKGKVKYIFVRGGVKETAQLYVYTNGYYKLMSDLEFKSIIKKFIPLEMQKPKDINDAYNLICMESQIIKRSQIDTNENIINFKNGVLHLNTMELKPHSPDYLCTKRIPCNYVPNAPRPKIGHFERYINHLTAGDKEKASLIMQFLGMAISNIRGYRPKKALFMWGEGDTGKSVIRWLAAQLVGEDNNSGVTLETLEARFGTSIVYGKRLVGSADMSFMTVKEMTAFKQLTGGDPIFAEYKGENGFTYVFDGVVWFCMNKLPKFGGDKGDHVYERMVIVECNPKKPEVLDSELPQKLLTEIDYIVSLAINELQKVIYNGYKYIIPQNVRDAREYYKTQNNSFLQFLDECTVERPQGKVSDNCTTKRFYDVYVAWCKDNNNGHCETKKDIIKILEGMGKDTQRKVKGNYYWSDFTLSYATKVDYKKTYGFDNSTNYGAFEGE